MSTKKQQQKEQERIERRALAMFRENPLPEALRRLLKESGFVQQPDGKWTKATKPTTVPSLPVVPPTDTERENDYLDFAQNAARGIRYQCAKCQDYVQLNSIDDDGEGVHLNTCDKCRRMFVHCDGCAPDWSATGLRDCSQNAVWLCAVCR